MPGGVVRFCARDNQLSPRDYKSKRSVNVDPRRTRIVSSWRYRRRFVHRQALQLLRQQRKPAISLQPQRGLRLDLPRGLHSPIWPMRADPFTRGRRCPRAGDAFL